MTRAEFDLDRFVQAQTDIYPGVVEELRAGRKRSHWMWFIFPQLEALGRSSTARFYGLTGAAHARAYWMHPVLGTRLGECSALVLAIRGRTAHEIFGSPDDLKLRSCMTLFEAAAPEASIFGKVLARFCGGVRDGSTLDLLQPVG